MIWLGLHNGSYIRACTPNNFGTQKYLGSCIDTVVIEMNIILLCIDEYLPSIKNVSNCTIGL